MIFWQFGTLHAGTIFKKWCRTISNIQITWGVVSTIINIECGHFLYMTIRDFFVFLIKRMAKFPETSLTKVVTNYVLLFSVKGILVFLLSDRRELYVGKKFSVTTCSSRVWHDRLAFIVT